MGVVTFTHTRYSFGRLSLMRYFSVSYRVDDIGWGEFVSDVLSVHPFGTHVKPLIHWPFLLVRTVIPSPWTKMRGERGLTRSPGFRPELNGRLRPSPVSFVRSASAYDSLVAIASRLDSRMNRGIERYITKNYLSRLIIGTDEFPSWASNLPDEEVEFPLFYVSHSVRSSTHLF